jgi:hypothetical protein
MHARRAADACERPPQPTERENFLLFVWLQDVAHGREGLHIRRRRQRLGRRQLIVDFEVSTNCRFWASTEEDHSRNSCTSRHRISAQPPRSGLGSLAGSASRKRRRQGQQSVARAGRQAPVSAATVRLLKERSSGDQAWRDSAATMCFATLRKSGPVMSGFGPRG